VRDQNLTPKQTPDRAKCRRAFSHDDAIAAKRDTISANQAAWGGKVKYPGAYWADASSVPQMLSDRGHWYNQMVL
jgi:hypothetical protein